VPLEQLSSGDVDVNELRTVTASSDATVLVSGDKYGVLRYVALYYHS